MWSEPSASSIIRAIQFKETFVVIIRLDPFRIDHNAATTLAVRNAISSCAKVKNLVYVNTCLLADLLDSPQ